MYDLNFSENFDIKDTQKQVVDIPLEDTQVGTNTITGIVLDQTGTPVEGATVKLFDSKGVPFMHTITNQQGNYAFSGLKSDSYSITCVKDKVVLTIPQNIFLQEEENKTFNFNVNYNESLNLCCVAGFVFKKGFENEVIGNANVNLLNAVTRETIASTQSAKDGEYLFYVIPEGFYILVASKNGYITSGDTQITAKNNTIVNTDLYLEINSIENTGTIKGVVTHNGVIVSNAFVGLYKIDEETNKESLIATTRTNAQRIYMFGRVESGKYKIKSKLNI